MKKDDEEKAIARLSLVSLTIDFILIALAFILFQPILSDVNWYSFVDAKFASVADVSAPFVVFAIILAGYFNTLEFLGSDLSLGRFVSGLSFFDTTTQEKPVLENRRQRIKHRAASLGLKTVNFNRLPAYNKRQDCCLFSDWVGCVSMQANTTKSPIVDNSRPLTRPIKGILHIVTGKANSQVFDLANILKRKSHFLIGKAANADLIILGDGMVSSYHCHIRMHNGGYIIQDGALKSQGSKNGTYLNKKAVPAEKYYPLKYGDAILIGNNVIIEFR